MPELGSEITNQSLRGMKESTDYYSDRALNCGVEICSDSGHMLNDPVRHQMSSDVVNSFSSSRLRCMEQNFFICLIKSSCCSRMKIENIPFPFPRLSLTKASNSLPVGYNAAQGRRLGIEGL